MYTFSTGHEQKIKADQHKMGGLNHCSIPLDVVVVVVVVGVVSAVVVVIMVAVGCVAASLHEFSTTCCTTLLSCVKFGAKKKIVGTRRNYSKLVLVHCVRDADGVNRDVGRFGKVGFWYRIWFFNISCAISE